MTLQTLARSLMAAEDKAVREESAARMLF